MEFQHILITGGAGFVGSNLAVQFSQLFPEVRVTALDNLKRRGSELNLPRLKKHGVEFVHGDVRNREDLEGIAKFDLLIDCAAEPSVHAGTTGSSDYVVNTNLFGTINSLEAARQHDSAFVLLSSSRVYPIERLNSVPFRENESRFCWDEHSSIDGLGEHGVSESFPLDGARSFYGASKLSAELMVKEYAYQWKMPAIINRCGILAGPWQMGKADQGVVSLWVGRHHNGRPLQYIGFGGLGKQVRDLLHVDDLFELLVQQCACTNFWDGRVYNIGGGKDVSVSLAELTTICQETTGQHVDISAVPDTSNVDVRIYLTDTRKAQRDFGWRPRRNAQTIVHDISQWMHANPAVLSGVLN